MLDELIAVHLYYGERYNGDLWEWNGLADEQAARYRAEGIRIANAVREYARRYPEAFEALGVQKPPLTRREES